MSTYRDTFVSPHSNPSRLFEDYERFLNEACVEVDRLRDENGRLKGLVVKKDEVLDSIEKTVRTNSFGPYDLRLILTNAQDALGLTPATMADFVCVKRSEWERLKTVSAKLAKADEKIGELQQFIRSKFP